MRAMLWVVLFAISTAAAADVEAPGTVLAAPGGRYVFGQVSAFGQHQFMLDTQTGRLWRMVCARQREKAPDEKRAQCEVFGLDPQPYLTPSGELAGMAPK